MQSPNQREKQTYFRSAAVCFVCVAACIFLDIRKFLSAGHLIIDWEFGISLLLYVVLIFLGIRSIRKGKGK